jgi:hypothetical protein
VAGRQGGRLVQEEEAGVVAGRHDRVAPALKLQQTADPGPAGPASAQALVGIVGMPRLPIIVPRSGTATISPNGVTRFWSGRADTGSSTIRLSDYRLTHP